MGPIIRGVVGDTLKVVFRNMLPAGSHNVSMHPHGVLYAKDSEGSPYNDGLPGECRVLVKGSAAVYAVRGGANAVARSPRHPLVLRRAAPPCSGAGRHRRARPDCDLHLDGA